MDTGALTLGEGRGKGHKTREGIRHRGREKDEHPREGPSQAEGAFTTPNREACHTPREEDPPEGTRQPHTKAQASREGNPTDKRQPCQASRPTQASHNTDLGSHINHTESNPPAASC